MAQSDYVMNVLVPEGAQPGQTMLVAAPTGQQVHVEIPAYATPGSTIAVSVPSAGPPPGSAAADVRIPRACGLLRRALLLSFACPRVCSPRGSVLGATTI